MKIFYAIPIAILAAIIVLALPFILPAESNPVEIQLLSDPYPMVMGMMELQIALIDSDGSRIENADLQVTTQLGRAGSPAIINFPNRSENGVYYVPVTWSMMGQARITVNAELPEGGTIEEIFLVYVYLVPPLAADESRGYRNLTKLNMEMSAHAEREYWIYIPQGASEMLMMSEIQAFVPNQINLHVSAQNTLIIRNDDFVDHNIGPFFIRAGETIRQEFTQAGIFEGTCSLNHGSAIRIVVEE